MSTSIEQTAASGLRGEWIFKNVSILSNYSYSFSQSQISKMEAASLLHIIWTWAFGGADIEWYDFSFNEGTFLGSYTVPGMVYKSLGSSTACNFTETPNSNTYMVLRKSSIWYKSSVSGSSPRHVGIYAIY